LLASRGWKRIFIPRADAEQKQSRDAVNLENRILRSMRSIRDRQRNHIGVCILSKFFSHPFNFSESEIGVISGQVSSKFVYNLLTQICLNGEFDPGSG
jgi:hypothetical protein